jgi:cytochrome c oxidase subunit 2
MNPSALHPVGPAADAIAELTWLFVAVCGVIYILTLAVFGWSVWRARRLGSDPMRATQLPAQRRKSMLVGAAMIASALVLSAFVGASFRTDRALLALEHGAVAEIALTGHQWWWEIRYQDPTTSNGFTTANELHLPLGEPVKISLASPDVIHSLWIPNIAGKRDIIPGRDNELWLTATEPGAWRGRCSEFCGYQHARMELLVVVEPRPAFDAWRAAQAAPAVAPTTAETQHGQDVFNQNACVVCHVVRGTSATGYSATAPDLTHLKSRRTIAAGALTNTKGNLGGWIIDPQSLKPGVRMPVNLLAPADFQDLLAYLESLE